MARLPADEPVLDRARGLNSDTAWSIVQDATGYLWVGTQSGLHRFDGHRLDAFAHDPGDPGSLAAESVSELLVTRGGELWIATWGGGVDRFDPSTETFAHLPIDPERTDALAEARAQTLFEAGDGAIWIGTAGAGIARYDPQEGSVRSFRSAVDGSPMLPHARVWDLLETTDGDLLVATGQGVAVFDPRTETVERRLPAPQHLGALGDGTVRVLHSDVDGRLLVGTGKGLFQLLDDGSLASGWPAGVDAVFDTESAINVLFEDRDGVLWIGGEAGLLAVDATGRVVHVSSFDDEGRRNAVWSVTQDRTGNLWIGTFHRGVFKLTAEPSFVQRVDLDQHGAGPIVRGISSDGEGILLATDAGPWRWDPEHDRAEPIRPDDPELARLVATAGFDVWVTRDGDTWWAVMGKGLVRHERASGAWSLFRSIPDDPRTLPSDRVNCLYEDRDGRLWIGTPEGLGRFDSTNQRFDRFLNDVRDPTSLSDPIVKAIFEDRDGVLWVGTDRGLNRQLPFGDGFERLFATAEGLPSDQITAITDDASGTLWIGTRRGLAFRPAGGPIQAYGEDGSATRSGIVALRADASGALWLATEHGLSRLDPQLDRHRLIHSRPFPNRYDAHPSWVDADGLLYFGHAEGFDRIDPSAVEDEPTPQPVLALRSIHLFDEHVDLPTNPEQIDVLELSWQETTLGIHFALLDLTEPSTHRYVYRLDDLDPDWVEVDARRASAHYAHLPPGHHRFRVKGRNAQGVWSAERILDIRIAPPPWVSLPAIAAYALCVLAAVVGVVRRQRRRLDAERAETARVVAVNTRLRELDELKDEFLAKTSHELRTPLYGMIGLAETLLDGREPVPEEARAKLESLVAGGRRLTALVDDILDASKLQQHQIELNVGTVGLHAAVDIVLTLSRPLVIRGDGSRLELINAVAVDLPPVAADGARLQQILHNLIGNAIKFTPAGSVEVSAARHGDHVTISVRDTGIGIAVEQQQAIFEVFVQGDASDVREAGGTGLGLAITRQLIELHGSRLTVDSTPGVGTTFSFDLRVAETSETSDPPQPVFQTAFPAGAFRPVAVEEPAPTADEAAATILVVDDEPMVREVLNHQLIDAGYRCRVLDDGAGVVDEVEREPPDLVLLDVMMPRLSGYEVCRALRRDHPPETLPIIFLSAKTRAEDRIAGFDLGANDYLSKPIARQELLVRVRAHLSLLATHRAQAEETKILRGLLPICSSCKKIRDEDDEWLELESYIDAHSEARFSHGFCPDCLRELLETA